MPLVRRRRPLLRAAAVGGAAYMGKHAAERREPSAEGQPQDYPPPAQAPAQSAGMSAEAVGRLKEMSELHDQGILTDQEFEQQKRALLGGGQ
jgi:hypothetical protein